MSEDRLERALEAMQNENVDPEQIAGARDRVRAKLGNPGLMTCTEFEPDIRDYLAGGLAPNRRLLMEDHLSRCSRCRMRLTELTGERKVIAMPQARATWRPRWQAWGTAAALLIALSIFLGRDRLDSLLAPTGPRATVASIRGALYRLPEGALQTGSTMGQDEVVRTGPGARAVLRLADGSLVDVNERSELFLRAAWSGQTIHLRSGDIIVQAAKQHRGQLQVKTRDSVVSVKGTVFAVSSGLMGTVVSVVQGAVAVAQPGVNVLLHPGEQATSKPALARSVQDAVSWSPDAEKYVALLASVASLEKQIAQLPSPALRTEPRLLKYLPANPVIYGAVPNLGGTMSQAIRLAEQQSAENPAFNQWWNSRAGQDLKNLMDRVQLVTPLLENEIVFVVSTSVPGATEKIPMVVSEVKPGRQPELASTLETLRSQAGTPALPFRLTGSAVVISDSREHLDWVFAHMGQGANSQFAMAIAERYQRGAGWLLSVNTEPVVSTTGGGPAELVGVQELKHLILEQRDVLGVQENEVTLAFKGPRTGVASWLSNTGSGGAAEYLSSEAAFATYASTREPRQVFDEITAQLSRMNPSTGTVFAKMDAKLGAGFTNDLVSAFGTETALAVEGVSTGGPVWVLAAMVNNPTTLDNSISRFVDVFNAELLPEDQAKRITLSREIIDGRAWSTMKPGSGPFSVTWTYDRGYLVAASDRGAALRAIAARDGGSALVWSPAFQQQLPSSIGLHPSAFAWLNTKGALQSFAALASNPTFQKLVSERDPILVVFDGLVEQIHSASRTRVSGLIMDLMLLRSLGHVNGGSQPAILQRGRMGTR
jgi:hypothetical protein